MSFVICNQERGYSETVTCKEKRYSVFEPQHITEGTPSPLHLRK
jgi:hypothetical protein